MLSFHPQRTYNAMRRGYACSASQEPPHAAARGGICRAGQWTNVQRDALSTSARSRRITERQPIVRYSERAMSAMNIARRDVALRKAAKCRQSRRHAPRRWRHALYNARRHTPRSQNKCSVTRIKASQHCHNKWLKTAAG